MRIILAAVDQSRHADSVVGRAAELASLLRTDLAVLTVMISDPMKLSIAEQWNQIARFHRELIFKHFPRDRISIESNDAKGSVYKYDPAGTKIYLKILPGDPVDTICRCAEELNADLVIVGNRGLGGVGGLVLGSVSERVVHKCPRSVMVVKGENLERTDPGSAVDSQQARDRLRT
jgi:nucleotide-binding universal stress UspA family protein